jgi:hypothetical protein
MTSGNVYLLINQSMPGLIKIGRIVRYAKERAREGSSTAAQLPVN